MTNQSQPQPPERLEEIRQRWASVPAMGVGIWEDGDSLYEEHEPHRTVGHLHPQVSRETAIALSKSKTDIDYLLSLLQQPTSEPSVQHPEDICWQCYRPNISWFGPNELWNKAVRANGLQEILCPVCFVKAVEAIDVKTTWEVAPRGWHEQETQKSITRAMEVINTAIDGAATGADEYTARFTDQELEYLYKHTDFDVNREVFLGIEKKIRKQIAGYREVDEGEQRTRGIFDAGFTTPPTNVAEAEPQTWCDHCSADLNDIKHLLCERCYRDFDQRINTRESLRERILDWLAHRCDRAPVCGNCTYCRVAVFIRDVEPDAPSTTTSEAAIEAAREVADYLRRSIYISVTPFGVDDIAAIISKHIPDDGEARLLRAQSMAMRLDADAWKRVAERLESEKRDARANAGACELCDRPAGDSPVCLECYNLQAGAWEEATTEVERLQSERLAIQRALASTVLDDPTEDDDPPYTATEIVHGVTSLDQRRRAALKRASDARANAIREAVEQIEAKQAEWEKLGDYGTKPGYVHRIEGANEILAALQVTS